MCGIDGIIGIDDGERARRIVARMNDALAHRGPDAHDVFVEGIAALGHRRLSIIDLSEAGKQPMVSADGRYLITYNGELYNYRDLRARLHRYPFRTQTDTEVLLAAYAAYGDDCVHHFNGMFAFAIWDRERRRLFAARDRLGIKPLYWHHGPDPAGSGDVLAFASELRALLASDLVPRVLDRDSLAEYLAHQTVQPPNTILRDIHLLPPGCALIAQPGAPPVIERYWSLTDQLDTSVRTKSYADVCREVRELLLRAVDVRLMSDVPLGAFLSGGIDSSTIVGLMSRAAGDRVMTFSVVFDDAEFSEAEYAAAVARRFRTDHHQIDLRIDEFREQLPEALAAMDHPSGDGPNTFVVSRATKRAGITVALSGLGGDELFAGYDTFGRGARVRQLHALWRLPPSARRTLGSVLQRARPGVASRKIAQLLAAPSPELADTYPAFRAVLSADQIAAIVADGRECPPGARELIPRHLVDGWRDLPALSRISVAEISAYMQSVLLRDTDQMSMAHALEVRVPFLDHRLVEYVLSVPDDNKRPTTPKRLLVDAVADLLPREIVDRPKMGFTLPWKRWLRTDLHELCDRRIRSLAGRRSFSRAGVESIWKRFLADDHSVTWARVWLLIVLADWLDRHDIDA